MLKEYRFVVRGHHILNLDEPGVLAKFAGALETDSQTDRNRLAEIYANYFLGAASRKTSKYFSDIAGDGPEQRSIYVRRVWQVLCAYMFLPADHVSHIESTNNDVFCRCCVRGKHCEKKKQRVADDGVMPKLVKMLIRNQVPFTKHKRRLELPMNSLRTLCLGVYNVYGEVE